VTSQPTASQPEKTSLPGLFSALFGFYNFLAPAIAKEAESEVVVGLLFGPVAAQLGLLSIWATLGPRPWRVRLPTTLIMGMGLYGALLVGMMASWEPPTHAVREMVQSLLFVPLVFLAAQLPLWILRFAIGCRIVLDDADEADRPTESRQFGVQHLLVATALVAIALGLASTALASEIERRGAASAWIELVISCVVCSLWSAFTTLPCLWAAFTTRDKGPAAVAMGGYTLIMALFVIGVIGTITHMPDSGEVVAAFVFLNGALVAVMLGVLHVARACGYVFVRARRGGPPALPSQSSTMTDPPDQSPSPSGGR
jgi:hypothetical protein